MRLKSSDGPLSVHSNNGNPDILNSPKRINTLQNSNITTNITTSTQDVIITDDRTLNNINTEDRVQWCNSPHLQQRNNRELLVNNANNRLQRFNNINNTLDTRLSDLRRETASSICSESSPDDSLLDYEDAHQSCSSADSSPQEEERDFDISDSESISEEGNLSNQVTLQRCGIVNPNYPGFQHLAHTLDYGIKVSSDTDDDFECEALTTTLDAEANNINNNNNVDETECQVDHIDGVNRLDSVENIQKVFYDKPVFVECENLRSNENNSSDGSGNSIQSSSDDDSELHVTPNIEFNIKADEAAIRLDDRIDTKEILPSEKAPERITLVNKVTNLQGKEYAVPCILTEEGEEKLLERAPTLQEIQEAVEKISLSTDLAPSATKYTIEPNIEQPLDKFTPTVLNDSATIKQNTMATLVQTVSTEKLTEPRIKIKLTQPDKNSTITPQYKMNVPDAFLSNVRENIPTVHQKLFSPNNDFDMMLETVKRRDSNRDAEEPREQTKMQRRDDEVEKFCKEDKTKDEQEKDEDSAVPRKKEKVEISCVKKRRDYNNQTPSLITIPRREMGSRNRDSLNRRSMPVIRDKKRAQPDAFAGFDVYNIETAMPKIDLEAIESHLRAAREEERRRRTDREEIRRRLAMGSEDDYYSGYDRPGRKPSLQSRLQSGMNLQICFMNETNSDTESPNSDSENTTTNNTTKPKRQPKNINTLTQEEDKTKVAAPARPATLSLGQPLLQPITQPMTEVDFFARQARLQTEARMALAQAKEMARMQMEIERQKQKKSPITEMVRNSMEKVGIPFPEEKRRLSRQILSEMNVAQLQVIVNDLHTQIETLNENLVKYLMERDDLHMEQDSMLVDIEDLTRYLGAKEQTIKEQNLAPQNNNMPPPSPAPSSPLAALNSSVKPHLHRIASLVKK